VSLPGVLSYADSLVSDGVPLAVIAILVEWNRQNARQAEGELVELESAVSKQLDDIKVLNAHKNVRQLTVLKQL
jgi:hypothetical protein